MANLGAEVTRIISAKKRADASMVELSLNKADQMIREIGDMSDMKPRAGEIKTLSRAIHALAGQISDLHIDPINIKAYFMPFALRLAENR